MKFLTIEVDDKKEAALKKALNELGIHFSESSINSEIPASHKKHILDIQRTAVDSDFISWKEMRERIKS